MEEPQEGRPTQINATKRIDALQRDAREYAQSLMTIARQKPVVALPVNLFVWERIKNGIDEVESITNIYGNAFWGSLGCFAGSLAFLLTISPDDKREWVTILAYVMTIVFLVFTLVSLFMGLREARHNKKLRGKLKKDMEDLEQQFDLSTEESGRSEI